MRRGNRETICIPRIGNEVIVEFLDGDPDRPLVTGSVYNPAQMPPYELPANSHTMGFKSNTTKGGSGYNEMAIVDGKAGELIRIHAQKDMDTTVLNNDTQFVVVDRTIRIDGKRDQKVKGDMSTTVTEGNQTNTVEAGSHSNSAATFIDLSVGGKTVVGQVLMKNDGTIAVTANTKITLSVGASSITIEAGKITIQSPLVDVNP